MELAISKLTGSVFVVTRWSTDKGGRRIAAKKVDVTEQFNALAPMLGWSQPCQMLRCEDRAYGKLGDVWACPEHGGPESPGAS